MRLKRTIYVFSFGFLGFLVQFLVHVGVEIVYIDLLIRDFDTFGLGLSFDAWFTIHAVGAVVLAIVGAAIGIWQGFYWWKRIYESF